MIIRLTAIRADCWIVYEFRVNAGK